MKNPSKEQVKKWNQAYYQKNKITRRKQYNKWRDDMRVWFKEYKSELKCERCGFDIPIALCFHHKDPSLKMKDVSAMAGHGHSKEAILKEIAKCEVLCHNCHAIEHAK